MKVAIWLLVGGIGVVALAVLTLTTFQLQDAVEGNVFLSGLVRQTVQQGAVITISVPKNSIAAIDICRDFKNGECTRLSDYLAGDRKVQIPTTYPLGKAVLAIKISNSRTDRVIKKYAVYVARRTVIHDPTPSPRASTTPVTTPKQTSPSATCQAYQCSNGRVYDRCTPEGYPINYFVDPCKISGGRL